VSWPVKELMVRRQRRLLRKWLRYAKSLKATKEERMGYICEPEIGDVLNEENDQRSLRDLIDCQESSGRFPNGRMDKETEMRSDDDLKNCQEGREIEIPDCQESNRLRSAEDLKDYHEDSQGNSHCQLGNEKRLYEDLEDCQEGNRSIEDCQEGRDEQLRSFEGLMESPI